MTQIAPEPTTSTPWSPESAFEWIGALPEGVAFARPCVEMVLAMFAGMVVLTSPPLGAAAAALALETENAEAPLASVL
jgi:hypothetical protein